MKTTDLPAKLFERILVGLDGTAMDEHILRYVSALCKVFGTRRLYVLQVVSHLDFPEELSIKDWLPDLPTDEWLKQQLKDRVRPYFLDQPELEVELMVREGSPGREILHWAHLKKINLLILGRKESQEGSSIISYQLARKTSCSVLLVPENAKVLGHHLWVANDFSEFSDLALQVAEHWASRVPHTQITAQYVYHLPSGYYAAGKSEEEFAEVLEGHAHRRLGQQLQRLSIQPNNVQACMTYHRYRNSPAPFILERAKAQDASLILLGARGRNAATAILLGSVAEHLLSINHDMPLLILKPEGNSFSFLDLLDSI